MTRVYDFRAIEQKWRDYWHQHNTFYTDVWDFSKPKYYVLDMFPYPSGAGLHAGHAEGYTATDIVARMKRMQGYNVLHPIGWDAFGLPAEQYAIDTGHHPAGFTARNIEHFKQQLNNLGISYDWSKEISTADPNYYHWTQWLFKQLYQDGLARCVEMPVNWCEKLGCVLANDEIVDGKSERGGYPVVKKNLRQWVIDMPTYAEKLLAGLDKLDWPESTKAMQRNWIGKSQGVEVDFDLVGGGKLSIYTTCIETIFGVTFVVLAPESKVVDELKPRIKNWAAVAKYRAATLKKTDLERTELNKSKTGCELQGVMAINPANKQTVPIYLGDFVLASYGTGAVMAVPSHDQRDFEFATARQIPMVPVIAGGDVRTAAFEKQDYLDKGCKLVNSGEFNGLTVEQAKPAITAKLTKMGVARAKTNYRLREWVFARQRYWGEPIPIVHLADGTTKALPDQELPLVLPELDNYQPAQDGNSPLAKATDWVNVVVDGQVAKRETNTMPGSAGSSWYFLRYLDPHNDQALADPKLLKHWLPVDLYVGGAEHAVGHLLYARMWHNYLFDKGLVPVSEPFKQLVHQGMILGANGIKMGKRYPEYVVDPNTIVEQYGADTLRLYEMFMGPLTDAKPWDNNGVTGARRFIERVFRLYQEKTITEQPNPNLDLAYHQTVKKVSEDYASLNFNTAIAQMMIFVNAVSKEQIFPTTYAEGFLKLLNPVCPFVTEELWQQLGHPATIAYEPWPQYDEKQLVITTVEIVVQVNAKIVARIDIDTNWTQAEVVAKCQDYVDLTKVTKTIYVKNKLINFIVSAK